MSVVTGVLYTTISGDATATANLSTFNGAAAVTTSRRVPDGMAAPFIHIVPPVSEVPDDTIDGEGREIMHDIKIVWPGAGDEGDLDSAAERVRDLLHRQDLTVSGWNHVMTRVTQTRDLPTESRSGAGEEDSDEIGLLMTVRVNLKKP